MTNKTPVLCAVLVLAAVVVLVGCEDEKAGPAPINVAEYSRMGRADRLRYPPHHLVQYNLTRVLNDELTLDERTQSLALVAKIGTEDETVLDELATLLRDAKAPEKLKHQVLRYLLKQNYRDLAAYLIPLMKKLRSDSELRRLVLEYIKNHPNTQMLAGIVRTWAEETQTSGPGEQSYRDAIKQVSGRPWDVTLLDEINSTAFGARCEALEILRRRLPADTLRRKILAVKANTDTMAAIQTFLELFDYMPAITEEIITTTIVYKVRRDMLPDAAKLSVDWSKNYRYAFNIRDFHLLSRLARDPLRSNLKRTELVLDVGKAVKTRKHIRPKPAKPGYRDNFWLQVEKLKMSDLWNLYLINEMLSRPRVQMSLRLMADGDLAERRSAWGGLLFYQNGQAEAILYPPDLEIAGSDLAYHPSRRLLTDGRDSLCRFIGHFEKIENTDRAGPTAEELNDAKIGNYYGLILTRLSKSSFCAHYYNPDGTVVSLGTFPLR